MDAVEYLKEKERMIASMRHCIGCDNCEYDDFCNGVMTNEKQVALVEQWSKEHPIKTYKSEFLKLFPDAELDRGGNLMCCVRHISGKQCPNLGCHDLLISCKEGWDSEFKGWS